MSEQKKKAAGQAAVMAWKEGFEKALATWRAAAPEGKKQAAMSLLAYISETKSTLQAFVDEPGVSITAEDAAKIREDFLGS